MSQQKNKFSPKNTGEKQFPEKEARTAEKRAKIMQAAIQVFARKGYPQGTVADIAREAGISYGLAYNYFENKNDILLSLFRERWQRFIDYIEYVRTDQIPPEMKLQKVGNFLIRSYERDPELMKVLVLNVVPHSLFFEKNSEAIRRAFQLIQSILEEGRKKGIFKKTLNSQITAQGFYGGILQILVAWVQGIISNSPRNVAEAYHFIQCCVEGWTSNS